MRPRRPFWRSGRIVRASTPSGFNSFRMIPRFSQWRSRVRDGTILPGRHFSCLTPAVTSAVRRSVRIPGETGGADETEEASGTTTPCTADDPTRSPADPGAFPVKSSLREMGSRGLGSCGLCRAGLASREPRWISASRSGITGTDFGRAPGAVAHPGRGGASLGRIRSGRAFGSSAGHLGRPTSSTHPSSRAPRSVSTSLNP